MPLTLDGAVLDPPAPRAAPRARPPASALVAELGAVLEATGIRYCQWKGLAGRDRWAAGLGDLDLLIDRSSAVVFARVLAGLGFREAVAPPGLEVPGVLSYLAPDPALGRLIHVHAHFQLVVGRPWARHTRLPIEAAVLASAVRGMPFRVPAPEFALLLLVVRSTLQHDVRDLVRRGDPPWLRTTRAELAHVRHGVGRAALLETIERHVPEMDRACLDACLATLEPGAPAWRRVATRMLLERRLTAHARRPPATVAVRRVARAAARALGARPARGGKHLATGGAVIALVGPDGSGKSTCARALESWLTPELDVEHAHMGRPPRTAVTLAIGAAVKLARRLAAVLPHRGRRVRDGHLTLLRCVCTARDRFLLHRRLRRRAAAGAIVICERYPIPENRALVGPSYAQGVATDASGPLATLLRRLESRYYARLSPPDLVLALRVDPETAVLRKPGEPEPYVRARARILWNTEWSSDHVELVDAGEPLPAVVATLRARIWEAL